MKKNLLLAALAVVSVASYAQEDFTPTAYKFSQRAVGEKLEMQATCSDWNAPALSSTAIETLAPNGGLVYLNAQGDVATGMNATCIVDLGGNVGHVLAITGADMAGLNEAYKANGLGEVKNAPESPIGAIQFNAYTDPSTTPEDTVIQADIVVNAWCTDTQAGTQVLSNYYYMTSANDVTPSGSNAWAGNALYAPDFCQYDEDGELVLDDDENPIYDPNRWLRLTTYCWTLTKDTEDWPYSNAIKAKLWTGGSFNKVVLFVKELTFKTTTGVTKADAKAQTDHARTVETWAPDPDKQITAINTVQAAAKFNVVGDKFVTTEAAEVYTIDGRRVANVAANGCAALAAGTYVAKIGNGSVKFAVK